MNQTTRPARLPQEHGLTQQADQTWTGETPSTIVPDNAATAHSEDGTSKVWIEGGYIYRRNEHSSRTVAVMGLPRRPTPEEVAADREAEQANFNGKAARLRELTGMPPITAADVAHFNASPAPADLEPSLDDLIGMMREAAERADWAQVHEYALDIASIAEGNIKRPVQP